jgi:urease accessory protein
MNSCIPLRILLAATAALVVAPAAQAHPGDLGPAGLLPGLAHPFRGFDHVLLLVGAGAWAVQFGPRGRWTVPAMLVSLMACGAALGLRGAGPPMLQTIALMALLAFALLVLAPVRWSFALIAVPLGVAVFFHGLAHASHLGASSHGLGFTTGLMAGSATLYAAGLTAGRVITCGIRVHRSRWTSHPRGTPAH